MTTATCTKRIFKVCCFVPQHNYVGGKDRKGEYRYTTELVEAEDSQAARTLVESWYAPDTIYIYDYEVMELGYKETT
jgi:hypothetical protein